MELRFKPSLAILVTGLFAFGCGGTITFQGQKAIAVEGAAPAAPPPAPMKAEMAEPRVKVNKNKIEIAEKIRFADNQATILEASFPLMNEIVDVLKSHPKIKKILVEGHASSEGNAQYNTKLSDERANSVMKYLEQHGIDKSRLSAKGFGSTHPIADNKTEDGREKNRRVDFTIVDSAS